MAWQLARLQTCAWTRVVLACLLLGFACCRAMPEDVAALAVDCSVEEREGISSFHVSCSGDLPDGTLVRVEISFQKPVPLPPALQKETGRQFELVPVSIGNSSERTRDGKANFVVGIMRRKPYSGEYVVSVFCPREGQKDDVLSKLGDKLPISAEKKLAVGKSDDFEVESSAARAALRADLVEMRELLRSLDALFRTRAFSGATANMRQEPLTAKELTEWTDALAEWTRSLKAFLERNDERPDLEVFWAEFVGRRTISLRADLLRSLAEGYDGALNSPPISADKMQDLQSSSAETGRLLEMDFEYFGFGKQLDVRNLLALVSDLKSCVEKLADWAKGQPSGTAPENLKKWETAGDEIYEGLVGETMELLTGLQGVSFRNMLALTNAVAEMERVARSAGTGAAGEIAAQRKLALEALERIDADVKAESSR